MFNLKTEVEKLQLLKHTKIHGLPYKYKQKDKTVRHIDGTLYEITAEQENTYIQRRFINRSRDFGQRLVKAKGERHHPGGGFAGVTLCVTTGYTGTTVYH